jgi:hypothetical protein
MCYDYVPDCPIKYQDVSCKPSIYTKQSLSELPEGGCCRLVVDEVAGKLAVELAVISTKTKRSTTVRASKAVPQGGILAVSDSSDRQTAATTSSATSAPSSYRGQCVL